MAAGCDVGNKWKGKGTHLRAVGDAQPLTVTSMGGFRPADLSHCRARGYLVDLDRCGMVGIRSPDSETGNNSTNQHADEPWLFGTTRVLFFSTGKKVLYRHFVPLGE